MYRRHVMSRALFVGSPPKRRILYDVCLVRADVMNVHAINRTQHGPRFCSYYMLPTYLGLGRSFTVAAELWASVSTLLTACLEAGNSTYPIRAGPALQNSEVFYNVRPSVNTRAQS